MMRTRPIAHPLKMPPPPPRSPKDTSRIARSVGRNALVPPYGKNQLRTLACCLSPAAVPRNSADRRLFESVDSQASTTKGRDSPARPKDPPAPPVGFGKQNND